MNVLGLVQLTQVAQDYAGYSYCFGIDGLVQRKRLSSAEQLLALLKSALAAAVGPADGVASGIAFRAARAGDLNAIPEVCAVMSSGRVPAEMRLASLQMGQHLWEISRHWDWTQSVHEQLDDMARRHDLHHAVAFGTLVSETTSSQVRAIAAYLFNVARSIVAAGVRVIPLDETEGQHVLTTVQPTIARLAASCADKHAGDIATVPGGTGWWDESV